MTVLLHGFWGQPQDWNTVLGRLPLTCDVLIPDLYVEAALLPQHELTDWTKNFLSWLDHHAGREPVQIVGYSMGARLALNALIANPKRFRRGLLLSGAAFLFGFDPQARAVFEQMWKERFESQPWGELKAAWQEQGIFHGSAAMSRRQGDEMRQRLAQSMTNWSVTKHPFGLDHLRRLEPAVEWAFGALDQKYLEMAKSLRELPVQGQISIIPNAGHRLINDAADFVADWIARPPKT